MTSNFGNPIRTPSNEIKYSSLLEQFLEPFAKDLKDKETSDEIIAFGINAWNFGNLRLLKLESKTKGLSDKLNLNAKEISIMNRMIANKVEEFSQHRKFMMDFTLKFVKGKPVLELVSLPEAVYLAEILNNI